MESIRSSLIRGSSVKVLLGEGGLAGAFHDVAVAVGTHPVVVEDLLQVAAAGIRGEHHHDLVLVQIIGKRVLDGAGHGHAGRAADQQRLLAGQTAGHFKGFGVGYAHDVVGDVPVESLGVEVLPHALDVVLVDFVA